MPFRRLLLLILALFPITFLSSCANENIRQTPELGLQVWEDTLEARIDNKYEIIWRAVEQAIGQRGQIIFNDRAVGRMEADIQSSRVVFRLKQIERKYGQLRIQAYQRETFDANLPLAYQIFDEVNLILKQ